MRPLLILPTLEHLRMRQLIWLPYDRFFRLFGARLRRESAELSHTPPHPIRFFCNTLPPLVSVGQDSVSIDLFGVEFVWRQGERWYSDPNDGLRPETLYYLEFLYHLLRDDGKQDLAVRIALDFLNQHRRAVYPHYSAYTTARRLVVLLFLSRFASEDVRRRLLSDAVAHTRHILRHLEHHLSANHLFKCAKGLLFGGLFIEHKEASLWRYHAAQLLKNEIRRQFLPSGCHYERCPTYHCAMVEDLLDIIIALRNTGRLPELLSVAEDALRRALVFLVMILHPDGTLPLFGDSANGLAPTPEQLFQEAERLGFKRPKPPEGAFAFEDSGFYGARFGDDFLIVTAGRTGAPDQPGHAHCDFGSFELSLGGRRIITDTGVYDYTAGARRDYARSTVVHNVVYVDGVEQARFWAVHRFASLFYPRTIHWRYDEKQKSFRLWFVGSVYHRYGFLWKRRFLFEPSRLEVADTIPGADFLSHLHFAPRWRYEDGVMVSDGARLSVEADDDLVVDRTPFWEHFYEENQRFCIMVKGCGKVWLRINRCT